MAATTIAWKAWPVCLHSHLLAQLDTRHIWAKAKNMGMKPWMFMVDSCHAAHTKCWIFSFEDDARIDQIVAHGSWLSVPSHWLTLQLVGVLKIRREKRSQQSECQRLESVNRSSSFSCSGSAMAESSALVKSRDASGSCIGNFGESTRLVTLPVIHRNSSPLWPDVSPWIVDNMYIYIY